MADLRSFFEGIIADLSNALPFLAPIWDFLTQLLDLIFPVA